MIELTGSLWALALARPLVAVLAALWAASLTTPALALALAAAVALAGSAETLAQAAAARAALAIDGVGWGQLMAREVARGAALGLAAAAPVWALRSAGAWARGIFGDDRGPVPSLFALAAGLAFLAVDGPALAAAALHQSYRDAPLGQALLAPGDVLEAVATWAAAAVRLAAPLLLAAAIASLGAAAAWRAAGAAAESLPRSAVAPSVVLVVVIALWPLLCGEAVALWRAALGP